MTFDIIVQRAIAKIAFNYAAKVHGADFVRNSSFDPTRRFIRHADVPIGYQVTTPMFKPILADDTATRRQTNGHLLTLGWDKIRSVLFAQVSLFNEITYVVRFCRYYSGVWRDVASGHLFDPFEHRIVQLANARSLVVPRFSV